ncbi:uncharacterized protein LOC133791605 [Humulus lupulus]|uniref:uncharacterized protein LOC133791605 n=1 Tax=Humulus lupulus TaxID=3486 RepID=UPI002B40988C|nr:uncharacterized protein LOC133791605 [Humulus lupulus]
MDGDDCDVYKVLDWDSLVIFPKSAAFTQGAQDKYLSFLGDNHLQIAMNDSANENVANEIFIFGDDYVRIKNLSTNKFWRRGSNNWIMADSSDTTGSNSDTSFWPVKVETTLCPYAIWGTTTSTRGLLIKAIQSEGRIYNVKVLKKGHAVAENLEDVENTITLTFSYKNSSSSTIAGNISLKLGVTTSVEVDVVPFVAKGKVKISAEVTGTVEWATTQTVETLTESTYTVKVPPRTRIIITLVATQGVMFHSLILDVKFSMMGVSSSPT